MTRRRLDLIITATGVAIWTLWAIEGARAAWQAQAVISMLGAVQAGLVAFFLLFRSSVLVRAGRPAELGWAHKIFAWAATLSPALFRIEHETLVADLMAGAGLIVALWALLTLGKSFGIAPADRGLVAGGPYRLVRHPMYLGQLILVVGVILGDLSPWNAVVLILIVASTLVRIRWEERIVGGYADYAAQVRWRLIPGVW